MLRYLLFIKILFLLLFLPNSYSSELIGINSNTEFGIPKDKDSTDDFIIVRPQYTLSYNHIKGVPNWVSYNLDMHWIGDQERYDGKFVKDTVLPLEWQISHDDYTNSGYDRGHMVMSKQRTKNEEDNYSTFYMTNVIPQTPDLNRILWLSLEKYCNKLAVVNDKELYVITGGIFHSDTTLNNARKVAIPDSCFKIIIVMNKDEGLDQINETTETISVVMPNAFEINDKNWKNYSTSIDAIEYSTGYDFLSNIPDELENKIESKVTYQKEIPIEKKSEVKKEVPSKTVRCKGRTKSGRQCKRMTKDPSGYCWQHK